MSLETHAVVLRKKPYQEDRLLLDLFSVDLGKITALVNRKQYKKYSDQIFQLGKWHLKQGKVFYFSHDYDLVENISIRGIKIWSGYYLNELLLRVFPKQHSDNDVFNYYWHTVKALQNDDNDLQEWLMRVFERVLLEFLGVMPDLTADNENNEFINDKIYYLTLSDGFVKFPPDKKFIKVTGKTIELINEITNKHDYSLLSRDLLRNYKIIMRFLLEPLLGSKPLQSRVWLQSLYFKQQEREKRSS